MLSVPEIDAIERDHAPSLIEAYGEYLVRWEDGARDRETVLRLIFLTWYACAEPPLYTKVYDSGISRLPAYLAALGDRTASDGEVHFVLSVMLDVAPWCLDDEAFQASVRRQIEKKRSGLSLSPAAFRGRGVFGEYFEHMLEIQRDQQ